MNKFIAITVAAVTAATAAPAVSAAQVSVAIHTPGGTLVAGRYYSGGRYYRHRAWNFHWRYGRRACAYRYWEPMAAAPRGYYQRGRHWRNRHWECHWRGHRRICAYRYW